MSTNVKNKNMYIHSLTDDFKKVNEGKIKSVDIDLTKNPPRPGASGRVEGTPSIEAY